jgi:hypothetical protein
MTAQIFVAGMLTMTSFVIGLRFLKFWRLSRDRFFLFFTAAFWTFALGWALRTFDVGLGEHTHLSYLPRLAGFLMILVGILDKNRQSPN